MFFGKKKKNLQLFLPRITNFWTKTTAVRLVRNSSNKTGTKEIAAVFEGRSSFIFVKKKDHTRSYNLIQGVTSAVCAKNKDIQSVAAISIFFRPCQRLQALAWTKTTAVRLVRNSSNKTGTKEIAAVFEGRSSFIFVKKKDHTRSYNLIQGVTTYISSMCTEQRYV